MKTTKQEHTVAPTFLEETGVVTAAGGAVSPEPTEGGPPSSESSNCSMSGSILGNSGDGAWNITQAEPVTATGAAVSPEPTEGGPPSSESSICSMSGFILGNSGDGAWNITWAVAGLTTKF
jgi:hypothetical protein